MLGFIGAFLFGYFFLVPVALLIISIFSSEEKPK